MRPCRSNVGRMSATHVRNGKSAPEGRSDLVILLQSQRDSNPCRHLERASRFVASGPGRSY